MKKSVSDQAIEYLQYLKEQGITHVPASPKRKKKAAAVPVSAPATAAAPKGKTAPAAPAAAASAVPTAAADGRPDTLEGLAAEIAACHACPLAATRINTVPGQGILNPDIMFIGEGPGQSEDEQGLAFVGKAGQLLTKMIEAMGYSRDTVFIGNIVKCRPPGNRVPSPEEMAGCIPYLRRQIAVIRPKLIVCLGATAVKGLVQEQTAISRVRGTWREFEGIPVMLTFHPAYLLRDPRKMADAWADLKTVLARLGTKPPPPKA